MLETLEPKEMVYMDEKRYDVLLRGKYLGVKFAIVSMGYFPACYVAIDEDESEFLEMMEYSNATHHKRHSVQELPTHNDVTYFRRGLTDLFFDELVIGWDYCHLGDRHGSKINGASYYLPHLWLDVTKVIKTLLNWKGEFYSPK